jgi:hypothetical protein
MSSRALRPALGLALLAVLASAAFAGAEVTQRGTLRVAVSGKLRPQTLPRSGAAPITVSVGGEITTSDKSPPPKLKALAIELNRNGRVDYAGLPVCPFDSIQPASSQRALNACRSSLVGKGTFSAEISLSGQESYPATGKLLLFNGLSNGKPVLFGQIYAPHPFATSFVIVFAIKKLAKGTYGTELSAHLPPSLASWGNLTGIEMTLSRRYSYRGKSHSYLSAGCPAPKGFPGTPFSLARASFGFAGGRVLRATMTRSCRARG